MAKNSIRDFSATAGSNTDIQSVNIDENCPASGINNAIRELMVDLKNVSTGAVNLETPAADSLTVAGDLTVDTNTLKVDSSNNRVGIGTAPDRDLHVKGATGDPVHLKLEGDPADYARIMFDDGTDDNIGEIRYHFGDENMRFTVNAAERMRIDSSGNVGIGTTSPDSPLHVIGDGKFKASGETKIRFQNDTTGTGSSDGSFVGVFGGTDGMALYNYEATPMRFFTSNAERMRITSSGEALIGTTSAGSSTRLHLKGAATLCVMQNDDANGGTFQTTVLFRNSSGSVVGEIKTNSSSVAYNTSSDHRLKENIADMTGAIARVKQLSPKRFNFIVDADRTVDGFLAHEAQAVVPEAVTGTHNEVDDDGNAVMQGIDQSKLVPLLTGALKEAIAKIETLETEMTALKARVTALEA